MSPLDWFKKEKPLLSMQSMGGGAAGYMISGAPPAIDATGGTKTTPGDGYVYHQFLSSGSFVVNNAGKGPDGIIDLCVVGGGGGAGNDKGGGGGAGGFRITTVDIATAGSGSYTCVVGSGGVGNPNTGNGPQRSQGSPGGSSQFAPPTSPVKVLVGGGGAGGAQYGSPPNNNAPGAPGQPYPFPTASPPHPNSVTFPGSGGGSKRIADASYNNAGEGAGSSFNSFPGGKGTPNCSGGGGGAGTDSAGPVSGGPGRGGTGIQLPWALPTWGWGENNDAGLSGQAPTSPNPTRPAGPGGDLPWGYGWFCGGGNGGAGNYPHLELPGYAGSGAGAWPGSPYGGPPSNGSDGWGYWAAPGTGSGGGGTGSPATQGGKGGSGAVMIRYPVG